MKREYKFHSFLCGLNRDHDGFCEPAAAPAPQAEGTSAYPITEGNSNWKYMGAAPAETAGHERIDEEGGKHYPGETAGEMTAEQRVTRQFVSDKMTDEQLQAAGMTRAAHKRVQKSFDVLFDCSEGWQKRAELAEAKVADLEREQDTLRRERKGEVWCWGDDGEDHPESLNCPVLMQPDVVRRFVAADSELREMRERVTDLVGIIGRLQERLVRKAGS